jgi:hypothetical protein
LITLTGCKTQKSSITTTYEQRDSVIYNISYKDTTIFLKKEVAQIDGVQVKVDSAGKSQLNPVKIKSGRAIIKASIKDGVLSAEGGCDEDSLKLLLEEKEKIIKSQSSKVSDEVQVIEKKFVPKWIQYLAIAGGIFIAVILGKLYKIISL